MKRTILISLIISLIAISGKVPAQNSQEEYLGLPGDNLNLYAVMKLFQESETLEGFERSLNDEKTGINNLDLNGDNLVDYIMVTDFVDGNVHNIVLRVALSAEETQDIAVFTVERFNDGSVQVQLVGDEALYGKNYIVEPVYSDRNAETPNPGYLGSYRNGNRVEVYRTSRYIVSDWPLIRFIFLPDYSCWHSPWYWGCSFDWWRPWGAWSWHYYYGYHSHWFPHYRAHFRIVNHYRYANYNNFYYHGVRTWSNHVHQSIREGRYRSTYSHPEQRRDGEARFASSYSERSRESRNMNSVSSGRRSAPETVRREQRSAGTGYNQRSDTRESGQSNYTNRNNSSVRRNSESSRPETSISRQRSPQSVDERSSTGVRKSATVQDRNRNSVYSPGNSRTGSSRTEASTVRRESSRSSNYSGNRISSPSVSKSERSASRERISGSSNRSSSSGKSSSTVTQKSASRSSQGKVSSSSRSSGRSSGNVSSRSSGGQSRSSVGSRSSGGSGRSSGSGNAGRSGGSSRSSGR